MQKLWIASAIISSCLISNSFATVSHTLGTHPIITSKNSDFTDFSDFLKKNHASFAVKNSLTAVVTYTQNGKFYLDGNGYFVQDGKRLQAYPITDKEPSCKLVDMKITDDMMPPKPTTTLLDNLNLNAADKNPADIFNPSANKTYNYSIGQTIYDSLGFSHNFYAYFVKSNTANVWNVHMYIDDLPAGVGTLTFSTAGKFLEATGLTGISYNPGTGAASPQKIDLNLTSSTSFAASSNVTHYLMEDGNSAGTPQGAMVDEEGIFSIYYSNGQAMNIYKLAPFNF